MPELDILDKKIMYELDLNARVAVTQIAKKVRAGKETVNFRLKRLLSENYVKGFYTVFNTSKLGYFYYKTFLKFYNATPEIENEITEYIAGNKKCAYLGSCEGPCELVFLIAVKNAKEFREFLFELKEKYGEFILETEVHTVLTTHRLNEKFLYAGKSSKHSYYQDEVTNYPLDNIDRKIIKIISQDARMSLVKIAEKINTDSKVIKYRIKNLEKKGIIIAYVSSPNFEKLGLQFIQLNFRLKNLKIVSSIIDFFDSTNRCLFALELLGKYDLTIEIHVENAEMLRGIIENFKKNFVNQYHDYDIFNVYREHIVVWLPFE